jgi:Spy/CpxP family protein refolding chaperone
METTKARREAAILFAVVFLLGALLGGVADHLWQERVWGHQPVRSALMPSRAHIIEESTRELQLTPEQQKELGAVIDDTRHKWEALYAPLDAQREQIRQEGRARIRAALTPEQQLKFDDLMRRLDERRKKEAAEHQEQR